MFKEILNSIEVFETIRKVINKNKIKAWIVGGYVRDLILKRDNYDIDIVCLGNGIQLAQDIAHEINPNIQVNVYNTYGTAMFKYNDMIFEFVGARKESYNEQSRNPNVVSGTFEDDQLRRDFTINTLAISLNNEDYGKLIDTQNGYRDLQNKVIVTPIDPDKTFFDDPLRMLRAIRFATQLQFDIHPATFISIKNQASRISIITQERITSELNKILLSPKPSIGIELLSKSGLLKQIMPYIENLRGKIRIGNFSHKDIYYHTLQVIDTISESSSNLWLRWAGLLHDISKPETKRFHPNQGFTFHGHDALGAKKVKRIFYELKLPKDKANYVSKLVALHLRPIAIAQDEVSDSGVRRLSFDAGDDLKDLMILCRADITSHNPERIRKYMDNFNKVEEKIKIIEEKDHIRNLQPVITGDMIMEMFKIPPSPVIGLIKNNLKNAILDGKINNTYDDLLIYLKKIAPNYIKDI